MQKPLAVVPALPGFFLCEPILAKYRLGIVEALALVPIIAWSIVWDANDDEPDGYIDVTPITPAGPPEGGRSSWSIKMPEGRFCWTDVLFDTDEEMKAQFQRVAARALPKAPPLAPVDPGAEIARSAPA